MIAALAPLLLATVLAQAPAPIDNGLTVTAAAGLDGFYRPGRWTPVHLDIETRSVEVAGELLIEWGRARVRRALVLAPPTQQHVDLYLRAGEDVRDLITVRLVSRGRELTSIEVPVRRLADEDAVVCLASPASSATLPPECTLRIETNAHLSRSWRAFDAADAVLWATEDPPPPAVAGALLFRRALRRVEDAGDATASAGAVPSPRSPGGHAQLPLLGYIAALGIGAAALRRRASASLGVPVVVLVIGAGAAVALAAGRGNSVIVHHATVVEQFFGTDRARVTMRGLVEFPTYGPIALRPSLPDGAFEAGNESDVRASADSDGVPVLEGTARLGSSTKFSLETVGAFRALDLTHVDGRIRAVNASGFSLRNCGFSWEERPPLTVAPGEGFETTRPPGGTDPIVSCAFEGAPLTFRDRRHPVVADGTTIVAYHILGTDPGGPVR